MAMAEPIPTPPSAAARRAIDVLATALPPDDDVVMSDIGIDAILMYTLLCRFVCVDLAVAIRLH